MKTFLASDLHVDAPGNAGFVRRLAEVAHEDRPDVLIIAGDVCNGTRMLEATLGLFAGASGHRIYVPGNHELWSSGPAESSARARYYREIPAIARAAGFHPLVTDCLVVGDVAFAGGMGWYDYSFADEADGFSEDEIASKRHGGMEWMDRRFVRWTDPDGRALDDQAVTALMTEDIRGQIDALADTAVRSIVLVTHHLAFPGVIPPVFVDGRLKFFRSFLGSATLGAEIAAMDERITLALAGHVHSVRSARHGRVEARTCPVGYPRERRPGERAEDRRLLLEL